MSQTLPRIRLSPASGEPLGPVFFGGAYKSGYFLVDMSNNRVVFYDSTGRNTGTYGRAGSGPDEFHLAYIAHVNGSTNEMAIYDAIQKSITLIDDQPPFQQFNRFSVLAMPSVISWCSLILLLCWSEPTCHLKTIRSSDYTEGTPMAARMWRFQEKTGSRDGWLELGWLATGHGLLEAIRLW